MIVTKPKGGKTKSKHTMRKVLIFALLLIAGSGSAQTLWGGAKIKVQQNDTSFVTTAGALKNYIAAYFSGGGTVSEVSVVPANGFAGTVANATSTPAITLTTSITGMLKGNGTALLAATAGTDYSAGTSALATGILKSTTTTGALTIAVAGDFPTLNQNTTGSAATLTTSRTIYGNSFNGSANVTGIIASTFGGTGNGFTAFTGPTTSEKVFTLPNASATILTSAAAVTAAQGGTGQTSYAVGDILYASTTSALSKLADVATGNALISGGINTAPSYGKIGLTTHVSGTLPVANGGTNLTAIGSDVTLLGSNGTANIYYTPSVTFNDAAFGYSRSTSTMNLNIPNATASLGGIVSTTTQTFAGAKTFTGAVTTQGLATNSAGLDATATSSQAAVNMKGVYDSDFREITTTSTASETDHTIYIGTLTADITLNLPACNSTRSGWQYVVLKRGADAFRVILDPSSTETIDSAATYSIFGQGNGAMCKCDSGTTNWSVIR